MSSRVWIVSELYYPEETSTGYLLTRIAEGLAAHGPVSVLCAQPTYSARGIRAPATEVRNGVSIRRCRGTTLNKDVLPFRFLNLVTISLAIFAGVMRHVSRGDRVIVVTNPPLLPFVVAAACRLRGARSLLLVHDVYPEALVIAGILRAGGLADRICAWLSRRLYRAVDRVIVLGRDMAALVSQKLPAGSDKIVLIPNWADVDDIAPEPRSANPLLKELGLESKWVVQYAGNMGRTHAVEDLLEAARRLEKTTDIHFLFIGSGAKRAQVEAAVEVEGLSNVTVLGNRARGDQQVFLNACDAAIIPFMSGMSGVSVPSRMYNILAAGKPIIAVCDADSELALVVEEENVGWIARPHQPERLVEVIQQARREAHDPSLSLRARRTAEKYALAAAIIRYRWLIEQLETDGDRMTAVERTDY
jgi:colanic acid biosynthesis glycosyl transferase WcaI